MIWKIITNGENERKWTRDNFELGHVKCKGPQNKTKIICEWNKLKQINEHIKFSSISQT
jgi:hypothetical protein